MKRFMFVAVLLSPAPLAAGCSGGYDDAVADLAAKRAAEQASRPASPPPEGKPAGDQAAAPSDEKPLRRQPASPPPRTEPRSPKPKPSAEEPALKLSAGVALPQTGPTGILMSFSVDYRFTQGRPDRASPYVWVIERSRGEPAKQEVRLTDRGTLQILIPGWRPEEGPFQTHIENAAARKLSDSAPLR